MLATTRAVFAPPDGGNTSSRAGVIFPAEISSCLDRGQVMLVGRSLYKHRLASEQQALGDTQIECRVHRIRGSGLLVFPLAVP